MKDNPLRFKNPPIIEAVLDIECDLPPNHRVDDLEERARKAFAKQYPKSRRQYFQEHQIIAKPNETLKHSLKGEGLQGLQFLHPDEKQVVQFRAQGFSFNRLFPYTGLDDYLPQIKKAWLQYVAIARPVQIRLIRLRYINRILIPIGPGSGFVKLEEWFVNGPQVADPEQLELIRFLNQYTAIDKKTGFQINTVLHAQVPDDDTLPIIFDNSAIMTQAREPDDWNWIFSKILELRQLKNHIFNRTLTAQCLNLFQPE